MADELLPCELLPCPNPWCDSRTFEGDQPSREDIWHLGGNYYRVQCPYCPMKAPHSHTEAGAMAEWNTRAALAFAQPQAGREELVRTIAEYQERMGLAPEDAWNDGHGIAEALLALLASPTAAGEG